MARQKVEDNLFYVIFRLTPTWATATIVVGFFVAMRYLAPLLTHNSLLSQMGAAYAPWLTFLLALFALYAEADKYKWRRLLSQQSSLDTLRGLTWQEFEMLVGEAYRRQGYSVEETGGSGPDGGVDLILRRTGETVLVQCKRWKQQAKVGAPTVRELRGAVARDNATQGIFVTSSTFTREAIVEAEGQPLELIDGAALLELVKQAQGQQAQGQPAPINTAQAPVAANEPSSAVPACPQCGEPMLKRTARSGANAGSEFWGCPAFPRCRGTRQLQ